MVGHADRPRPDTRLRALEKRHRALRMAVVGFVPVVVALQFVARGPVRV